MQGSSFGGYFPYVFLVSPSGRGVHSTTQSNRSTSFGPSTFFNQPRGSRNVAYTSTASAEGKLQSISSMTAYQEKCHEELRWEDYQSGGKALSAGQTGVGGSTAQSNSFSTSSTVSSTPTNPFLFITPSIPYPSQSSSNPFAQMNSSTTSQPPTALNSFAHSSSPNPFAPGSSQNQNPFAPVSSTNPFPGTSSSPFAPKSSSNPFAPNSSSNPFSPSSPFAPISSPGLFPGRSSSPFAPKSSSGPLAPNGSSDPFAPKSSTPFAPNNSSNPFSPHSPSPFAPGISTNLFAPKSSFPSHTVTLTPTVPESTSSLGPSPSFTNLFKTTPNPVSPFVTASVPIFSPSIPASSSGFSPGVSPISTLSSPTQTAGASSGNLPKFSPGLSISVGATGVQPAPMASPFGTLPAVPELSIGHRGSTRSIQYGISSLPVLDKTAAPTRLSPLVSPHHLLQRRTRLPVRKYNPNSDCPKKVPFYCNEEYTTDVEPQLFPRENPRALVIKPAPSLLQRPVNAYNDDERDNKEITDDGTSEADEDTIEEGQGINIEALMPKLRLSDYYTEPTIQELAVKERAEPGFSRRVTDFVVGRHGYGSIKFLGETNVERLELDSIVQFNYREVLVYVDEDRKPPVGEGLNKAAEVTLLNIKRVGKKTGRQYGDGPVVDEYKQKLMRKATEQGAEFVSYDPVVGEWKFRVRHFS